MKEVMETLGLIVGFVMLRLASAAWWLLKIFFGFCVVFGAAMQILKGFSTVPYESMVWYDALWQGGLAFGLNVADKWMAVAVLMLFFWVLSVKRSITKIESDVTQTKIGLVATMNYLEIEVRTEAMKRLKDEGILQLLKTAFGLNFWGAILGDRKNLTDDALTAQAVRHGSKVTLREDMPNYTEAEA